MHEDRNELYRSRQGLRAAYPASRGKLSPEQAARYLLLSISTLARMRIAGNGPIFVRVSPQRVGYRVIDLDKYLDGRTRISTSQN